MTHRDEAAADDPWLICTGCYARIRGWLTNGTTKDGRADNIGELYLMLNPTNRVETNGRRPPGFGSRPPASVHVMAMRDHRSNFMWTADTTTHYVWATDDDGNGAYVDKTVAWKGSDGKWYRDDTPSVSVAHMLTSWGCLVAEERTVTPPGGAIADLCEFLDRHLDWIARQPWVDDLHADLRRLVGQLHTATGNPRPKPVAWCIQTLDDGSDCDTPIFMPPPKPNSLDVPRLHCSGCGRDYTGPAIAWLKIQNEQEGKRCS